MGPAVLVHLLDEVSEHLLGHLEVRDHSVLQRADGRDRARRASEHPLGLDSHRVHLAGARIHRHDARFGQHDPPPAHIHERIGGPEVNRHVAAAEAGQVREEAHSMSR